MTILRTLCYIGVGLVLGLILSPLSSGDWPAMRSAIQYFGWVAVVLGIVIAATYVREK